MRGREVFLKILETFERFSTLYLHLRTSFDEFVSSFVRRSSLSPLRFGTTDEVLIDAGEHVAIELLGKS